MSHFVNIIEALTDYDPKSFPLFLFTSYFQGRILAMLRLKPIPSLGPFKIFNILDSVVAKSISVTEKKYYNINKRKMKDGAHDVIYRRAQHFFSHVFEETLNLRGPPNITIFF